MTPETESIFLLSLTYHSFPFLLISILALQDLQGEVEYFFLTVESPEPSLILTFTPEITSAVISDLWPSTTYLVSLQVSNGAYNTSKAVVNVTTADGSMCIFYYYLWQTIFLFCFFIQHMFF